jgi:hypothetical protein
MTDRAAQHNLWKRRTPLPTMRSTKATNEALDRMADDLDAARRSLTDLALGVTVVKVQAAPALYVEPDRKQAAQLASDPTLLPALLSEDLARIYALPPHFPSLKLLMGYVMGATPTTTEAVLRRELEESHRNQALLAQTLREHVPSEYLAPVAAELRRIAAGDRGAADDEER